MARTKQQQHAITTALNPDNHLIKIKAVAGAGKTFTLVELAKEYNPAKGLYLAYNKAIAEEANEKFEDTNVKCMTIHSLAYSSVVRQYGFKVGYFSVRNVEPSSLPYMQKKAVVDALEGFCLSNYLDSHAYCEDHQINEDTSDLVAEHLDKMSNGEIYCGHSFYLKYYHACLLTGSIEPPEVDLLLVDEAGDISALTLDVFNLIKADTKIAVGDPMQNIYSFNQTINAFEELEGKGVSADLTQSFRVSEPIACRIEGFVKKHLDTDFSFIGKEYLSPPEITTKAYISRNNSGLLEEMFRLMSENVLFHTTRKIGHILEAPLVLANLGNGEAITEYKYKHVEKLRKEYEATADMQTKSIQRYVMERITEDEELETAYNVLMRHGPGLLNQLTKYATECKKHPCGLTLTTAHSSKGLEFHEVEIAPDLNEKVDETLIRIKKEKLAYWKGSEAAIGKLNEELRLYYVACSRAMVSLLNAKHLPSGIVY